MSRYISGVGKLAPGLVCVLLALGPLAVRPAAAQTELNTAAIAQEVSRSRLEGKHVLQVWWLPVEYWMQAGRETGLSEAAVADIKEHLGIYTVLAIIDGRLNESGSFVFREFTDIAPALTLVTGDTELKVLPDYDEVVARMLPDLAYLLRVSLGQLNVGLRLILFANLGPDGKPSLSGSKPGVAEMIYEYDAAGEPLRLYWHAPLTSIVGAQVDPKTGESLEANWRFNPWTGEKLGAK